MCLHLRTFSQPQNSLLSSPRQLPRAGPPDAITELVHSICHARPLLRLFVQHDDLEVRLLLSALSLCLVVRGHVCHMDAPHEFMLSPGNGTGWLLALNCLNCCDQFELW